MQSHRQVVTRSFLPHSRTSPTIRLQSRDEGRAIAEGRGRGAEDVPSTGGPLTISELIADQARVRPDAVAIAAPERAPLTFSGLQAQVERTRAQLHANHLGRDDRVALMLGNGPELATAFLAITSTLACAPLNPAYRETELDFYISDLGVAAVVVAKGESPALREVAANRGIRVIELERSGVEAGTFEITAPANQHRTDLPDPTTVALLLHTSGTTAKPKLVPLTQQNLIASARNVASSLALDGNDRCLNVMPLFHIHGIVAGVLAPLSAGGATICTPGLDPTRFLDWLWELDPTWYTAVPTMHHAILSRPGSRGTAVKSSLRLVRSSSAALPRQVLEGLEATFGCPVIEAYGMTEASHQMAANPLPPGVRKPGSVGVPSGVEIAILDEHGAMVKAQTVGEVAIRGPGVFAGYEGNAEATERAFSDGWFLTGDLGMLDADGYLALKGRSKEIINRGGEKISPLEVEDVLLDHEAVSQAVVFGQSHPTLGEGVAAAVVLRNDKTATERAIREFAATRLADFKVPATIVMLDELPKGPTGKVQRVGLAARLGLDHPAKRNGSTVMAPQTPLETELVALWNDLFDIEHVGIDDDFFALGGDSLAAAELFAWIVENGYASEDLPLSALLTAPTISALADVLERKSWQAPAGIVVVRQGEGPPLFYVAGLDGQILKAGPLASCLDNGQPCYALVPPGEGNAPPAFTIEWLAAFYLETIRGVQPEGPYYLFGRCMGAGVVLEVARVLLADGHSVRFLGLFDPIGDQSGLALNYWRRLRTYHAQGSVGPRLMLFLARRLRRLRNRVVRTEEHQTAYVRALVDAVSAYVPTSFSGSATLFRDISYPTPPSYWRKIITGGLRVAEPVADTPPGHYEMLASELAQALAEAGLARPPRADHGEGPSNGASVSSGARYEATD
jgi:oxalate---CoA ligase